MKFLETYYPVLLAFISFLLSVSLWFNGQKEEGMFVGIWVPSILCFAIFIKLVQTKMGNNKQNEKENGGGTKHNNNKTELVVSNISIVRCLQNNTCI